MLRAARLALPMLLAVPATGADAQSAPPHSLALKRAIPPLPARAACPAPSPVRPPTDAQRRQARALAQRGQQAAILGDRASARDQLRQAVALDPSDADLAYQLARADEMTGASAEAAREYCRFLALAPGAPEAAEARDRLATLARPSGAENAANPAVTAFQQGIALYDAGRMAEAETAFSAAIAARPDWADAHYDRALVRSARHDTSGATSDFERYLRLKPEAEDRALVVARIDPLRPAPAVNLSPGRALALGLVIPGGGQFYTGRPGRGLLALAGSGAALGCAFRQSTSSTNVQETALDPFGNPYTFTSVRQTTTHPCLAGGLTAAGVIAVASAVDAFHFARRVSGDHQVALQLVPLTDAVALGVSVR
jgi:tetratricopeptide (TPR) repeat protein